jgi:hypothetical protein
MSHLTQDAPRHKVGHFAISGEAGLFKEALGDDAVVSVDEVVELPAPNSRYQGFARRQSCGDRYCLTLNCWVAMGKLVLDCRKQALALIEVI